MQPDDDQPASPPATLRAIVSSDLASLVESPKEGVLELLDDLARDQSSGSSNGANGVMTAALECSARLNGALGRNENALRDWCKAAEAGSARAQLDLGVRRYNTGTASTVYYQPGSAPPPGQASSAASSAAGAEKLLRAAAANPHVPSLGLEGKVIQARAYMILGMMALDGDGSTQSDEVAFGLFERAARVAKAGKQPDEEDNEEDDGDASAAGAEQVGALKYWDRSSSSSCTGKMEYRRRMRQSLRDVEADAKESMESMEGYMFFRNGRP